MKTTIFVILAFAIFGSLSASLWEKISQNALKFKPTIKAKHTDCQARWKAGEREPGVYTIYPNGTYPVDVFCNHTASASFTVIQRRIYGTVNFYRGWSDYRNGFGDAQGDYWIGLETLYHLTKSGKATLRIDLQDWNGNNRYVSYNKFSVATEKLRYRLQVGKASGQLVDDMAFSNGMMFYTYDSPDANNCAGNMKGGWWYNYCAYSLLNGIYYYGGPYTPSGGYYDGIFWKDWMDYGYSLKFTRMTLYH